jgi:hypothetical protein
MRIEVAEDMKLFLASRPRRAPKAPQEDFSLENLLRILERMQAVVDLIQVTQGARGAESLGGCLTDVSVVVGAWWGGVGQTAERAYSHVMQWRDPVLTALLMVVFVYACLYLNAEYGGALPVLAALGLLSYAYYDRRTGSYRKRIIEKDRGGEGAAGAAKPLRSIATLKVRWALAGSPLGYGTDSAFGVCACAGVGGPDPLPAAAAEPGSGARAAVSGRDGPDLRHHVVLAHRGAAGRGRRPDHRLRQHRGGRGRGAQGEELAKRRRATAA